MPDHKCPSCDGRLRTKIRQLMFACQRCEQVIVEISDERSVVSA